MFAAPKASVGAFSLLNDPLYLILAEDEPPAGAEPNDCTDICVISFPVRYMASRPAVSLAGGGGAGL